LPEPAPTPTPTPAVENDRETRAQKSIDNLKTIGVAVGGFRIQNHGRFPAVAICKGGTPLLSWRVAILPFLDIYKGTRLYRKFRLDEPWDSAHNRELLKEMPSQYAAVGRDDAPEYSTYYQAFVGPGALFDGDEGTVAEDVTDGIGSTLMIAEAAEPVPWTKPDDLRFNREKPLPRLGGLFDDGFHVAFADCSAGFIRNSLDPATLRALITRNDGEVISFNKL
jgi:hypothetical protein